MDANAQPPADERARLERQQEAGRIAQFVASGGQQGELPAWWDTMQAARYLGVAPWELDTNGTGRRAWQERALVAMLAERMVAQAQQMAAQMRQHGPRLVVPT